MAFRATIEGHVQGVGFREATCRRAEQLGVRGWVANRDDGTVELHAEGPEPALAELQEFLSAGPPAARVTAVRVTDAAAEAHTRFAII